MKLTVKLDFGGGRVHMASAAGLLHADFRIPGDEKDEEVCEVFV